MAELYEVVDPRPAATSAPYTFYMPPPALIAAVQCGDHVKAIIRSIPPSEKFDAERMWIEVTSVEANWLEGVLESEPHDMPNLPLGTIMRVPLSHVIDVGLADTERYPTGINVNREYWERCIVDQCVLDGQLKVGYLYREEPNAAKARDKFPDSGWRIRGDMRKTSSEEIDARKAAYVALGAVLNRDDSWLHLIDEPIGARYEKNFESGAFVPEK